MALRMSVIALLISMHVYGVTAAAVSPPPARSGPEADRKIWSEFVSLLKSGKLGEARLRPAYSSASTMLGFLETMRGRARWAEWESEPEIHRVGSHVHFVVQLSEGGKPGTYSFTFLTEGTQWFLQHFESIVLRLDQVGPMPVSTFPDLPEDKKTWMRQENYWSQMIIPFFGRV